MGNKTEPMSQKELSRLQEKLVALYLRLNGYFTTGLIIHSDKDSKIDGEIDIIGVRFFNHKQEDRIIDCSEHLEIPKETHIDIIIGEVKGGIKGKLQFNESLRINENRRYKLLTWLGFLNDNDISSISEALRIKIAPKQVNNSKKFERIDYKSELGIISIRPIIFAPDRKLPRVNQPKYINGQTIIDYCWKCFRPEQKRDTCETDYTWVNNWGEQFEPLVKYFKMTTKTTPRKIDELYNHFKK